MLLGGFIAAVVLDKAHNLVRKGFPAGFAEMDMNVKGRAADVLHKVGFVKQPKENKSKEAVETNKDIEQLLLSIQKAFDALVEKRTDLPIPTIRDDTRSPASLRWKQVCR